MAPRQLRSIACFVLRATPLWATFILCVSTLREAHGQAAALTFNRDIRPILSEACFACHGPDSAARKSKLRLDRRVDAMVGGRSGRSILSPAKPDQSELLRRILSLDPNEVMPPPESGKTLTAGQAGLLKSWINEGATYEPHWAFQPLQRPALPKVYRPAWVLNPIDTFVLSRLEQEGLSPSIEAPPEILLRRLSLDLTGLGPSPEETRKFLTAFENRPQEAVRQAVRELLASPRHGEHMAVGWLDLARYADSSGFQGDPYRSMWRWRDYVIQSFNQNKGFDQFTLEQIAGDLLPNPTLEQRLATGFHRNHRFNTEFGSINDEWLFEYAVDRVETTGATWLGLTLGCARCHDHKFDPIPQKEFYQFAAFFQNTPERGVFWDGNSPAFAPSLRAADPAQEQRLTTLRSRVEEEEARLTRLTQSQAHSEEMAKWERRQRPRFVRELQRWAGTTPALSDGPWRSAPFPSNVVLHLPLDGGVDGGFGTRTEVISLKTTNTHPLYEGATAVITQSSNSTNQQRFSTSLMPVPAPSPAYGPGRIGQALRLEPDGSALTVSNLLDRNRFTVAFWVKPESANGVLLHKLGRQELFKQGILLSLVDRRLHFELHHQTFDFDATMVPIEATTELQIPLHAWSHLALSLDGKRRERGPVLYVDGREIPLEPVQATARGINAITNSQPFRLGMSDGAGLSGWIDDLWVFDRPLSDTEVRIVHQLPGAWNLALPSARLSAAAAQEGREFHASFLSPLVAAQQRAVASAAKELQELERNVPEVMVMAEKPGQALSHILFRGQYDSPREEVTAGVPSLLGSLPDRSITNRLGLAQWLVSRSNSLTARVVMNRLWDQLLGGGLVRSIEDLGSQSEAPSHPALLDWLASEFIQSGWDLQAMIRLIVSSATYRQSSAQRLELLQRDPENRLLARAARFRLTAEAVRDQALQAAGTLVEKVGGPSVSPYTPGFDPKESPDLYRRSVYSVWQRTRFNPSLATFDAPAREICTVKRPRTNTPLQALALMNEVTFVEAARKLGEHMMRSASSEEDRLRRGFQRALARSPDAQEMQVLQRALQGHLARYQNRQQEAMRLIQVGASPPAPDLAPVELAAYTLLASTLFNLDGFITRE